MEIKMKHLKTYEKYYVDGNIVYHYTSLENALAILYQNELKYRRYGIQNKYLSGSASSDYGYVSFTENKHYHEETSSEIPVDVRFVFDLDKLEKDYKVFTYDANQDEIDDANIVDDLDKQNIPYYGEEMEVRIYDNDIPIKKYLNHIDLGEVVEDLDDIDEFKTMCDQKGIIYKEQVYW